MTRAQLETKKFTHPEVVEAVYHIVQSQMDEGTTVKALKVTEIDTKGLKTLALTEDSNKDISLWVVEFKFADLGTHENFVIQNCSRVEKTYELPERRNSIEIQGLSPMEANAECFRFFLATRTFEQTRQLKELQKLQAGV